MSFIGSAPSFLAANYKLLIPILTVGLVLLLRRIIMNWLRQNLMSRTDANASWILAVIVVICFVPLALVYIPKLQTAGIPKHMVKTRLELENEARRTLVQILAGIVVIAGIYLTWRRIVAMEERVEVDRKRVEVDRDGQVTDRYTKAIEQLGAGSLTVRLGGIYALERIARDSPDDHWTIMDVITAFMRENFRVRRDMETGEFIEQFPVPTDLQAILYVLRRSGQREHQQEPRRVIDLRETDLSNSYLGAISLRHSMLCDMNLGGAFLDGADLEGAYLENTNLQKASLVRACLRGANLCDANLEEAILREANLINANLEEADRTRANLHNAVLRNARLNGACLHGASLAATVLEDSQLFRANLQQAQLIGTKLRGARLDGAALRGARLPGAAFPNARLGGTELKRSDPRKTQGLTKL